MAAPPDLVVVQPVKEKSCAECGGTGDLLIMDEGQRPAGGGRPVE